MESYDAPADTLAHMITMLNDVDVLSRRLLGLVSIPEYAETVLDFDIICVHKSMSTQLVPLILSYVPLSHRSIIELGCCVTVDSPSCNLFYQMAMS